MVPRIASHCSALEHMPKQNTLPPTLAPRLLAREPSAAYVCTSPNTFDVLVEKGVMPKPRILSAGRKAWDVRDLDAAVDRLPYDGADAPEHGWS
jgi:hypothetical protein